MPGAFLHPFAKPTRESFIRIVRGEGALLWDADGRELVDGMASLWYCAIGHGRREMAEAIAGQAATLAAYSTFDPFTTDPAEQLAEALQGIAPMPDARIFYTCSGSEAIDTAMKLGANHPMGPLQLADFIGLDTCLSVMQVLHEGLADTKYRPCPLLVKYVEAGWLGKKTQRGFYDYRSGTPTPTR
jgi:hypothetical protein